MHRGVVKVGFYYISKSSSLEQHTAFTIYLLSTENPPEQYTSNVILVKY